MGVYWFRKMRFPAKAAVILTLLLVPLIVAVGLLVAEMRATLNVTRMERLGLRGVTLLMPSLDATQLLRRALVDQANGVDRPDLPAIRSQFKTAFDQLDKELPAVLAALPDPGAKHIQALSAARQAAAQQPAGLSASELRKPYVTISAELRELVQHMVDASGLALDPEGDSYYLMLASTVHLPSLMETLGLTRGALASLAADPQNGKLLARAAASTAQDDLVLESVTEDLQRAEDFNAKLPMATFRAKLKVATDWVNQMEPLVMQQSGELPAPAQIVAAGSAAVQAVVEVQRLLSEELDRLLQAREARLLNRMVVTLGLVALMVAAGLYFFYCFFLSMRSGMRTLTERMPERIDRKKQ